jgi:mRNA-degrading endonuclease HigB of HigAB toxin-antitoxin module
VRARPALDTHRPMSKLTLPTNPYRLIVAVDFEKGIVWIKWIGTHRDYDKIDVKEVQDGD